MATSESGEGSSAAAALPAAASLPLAAAPAAPSRLPLRRFVFRFPARFVGRDVDDVAVEAE